MAKTLLVTGSSGLIGSEVSAYFEKSGWNVHGLDNNMRAVFFGPHGDNRWNQRRLLAELENFQHHELDIRDRGEVLRLVELLKPDAIVHTAAQPSHDLAATIPFDDFDINATGTLNLLEASHRFAPDTVFVLMSTNKVYGDAPNELPLEELNSRWEYKRSEDWDGINESMRIDQSKHSLFGASKVAADIMVQEYGRYFGMKTCCLRGGCLTGPNHSGVAGHGFLSYLSKCCLTQTKYMIYGYKGKQVRDNVHSLDVARFIEMFIDKPRIAEVYNLGGGRQNSCSVLEAIDALQQLSGKKIDFDYVDKNREGDHMCYISDLSKMKKHFPEWGLSKSLEDILFELIQGWNLRYECAQY